MAKKKARKKASEKVDPKTGEVAAALDAPFSTEQQRAIRETFADIHAAKDRVIGLRDEHLGIVEAAKDAKKALNNAEASVRDLYDRLDAIESGEWQESLPLGEPGDGLPEGVADA